MKGTGVLATIHQGFTAGMFSPGCCLLSSTSSLGQSQAPRPACLAPSMVSHRGVCLQMKRLNQALTLPVVSVMLGLSLLVQGGGVLLQIWLACFISPLFPAGSGNIYFINIYKKLKISLLSCHKLILLCL